MSAERLIKKYPNRRLYDTSISAYITIDQVREMVLSEEPFKVVEQKTGEDITRNILMQIILDQESDGGKPMFTVDMLNKFIRNYGTETQQQFTDFMTQSLSMFTEQQEAITKQMNDALKGTPMETWAELGQQQMKAWQDMQKNMFGLSGEKKDDK